MAEQLDFAADEFISMTHDQRIRLCRRLAPRAEELAAKEAQLRQYYLGIARSWWALGEEFERQE